MFEFSNQGFLEKNRDAVSLDLIKMVDVSTSQLLREMFQSQLPKTEKKISINNRVTMTPRNSVRVREFRFPYIYHATKHNFHLKEIAWPLLQLDLPLLA